MDQGQVDQIGNGHIEPCRDLKSLEKKFEDFKNKDFRNLKVCVDDIKLKTVPRWVFIAFVVGLTTVSVAFISWHVSAIKTIAFEATAQQAILYNKIDALRTELVDLKVQQAQFNTKFNTIQERVIETLREYRTGNEDIPHR